MCTFAIYSPGLSGDFEFDDSINILDNNNLIFDDLNYNNIRKAALSGNSGPLKRPISMLSFAINHYLTGPNPYFFKLTNLIIHLMNGIMVFIFSHLILQQYRQESEPLLTNNQLRWIAIAATTIWLFHPLNLTTVLYVVQRMTSLASLFTLIALCSYIKGRHRLNQNKKNAILYFLIAVFAGIVSIFCKETGILLPCFMLTIEATLFRFKTTKGKQRNNLIIFYLLTVLIPSIFLLYFIIISPEWLLSQYITRDFNLAQRLLTETRVIWFYIGLIMMPNIGTMGLYHDDFTISTTLIAPTTTIPSVLGIFILTLLAITLTKRKSLMGFGISWFIVGHLLESTIFPLELVHEHRNYLPIVGLTLSFSYFIINPFVYKNLLHIRYYAIIILSILLGACTMLRSGQWGSLIEHTVLEAQNHPNSFRANYQLGRIYFMLYNKTKNEQYLLKAKDIFKKTAKLDSIDNGALFALYLIELLGHNEGNESVYPILLSNLKNNHLAPNTLAYLKNISKCLTLARCKTNLDSFKELYISLIENPHNTEHNRTLTKSLLAHFFVELKHDIISAYQLMNKIVINNPDHLEYRMTLLSLLDLKKDHSKIRGHLEAAIKLDNFSLYKNRLNYYSKLIN